MYFLNCKYYLIRKDQAAYDKDFVISYLFKGRYI